MSESKKVVNVKTWIIQENTYEDGSKDLTRTNQGFNGLEIMGIASLAITEIAGLFADPKRWRKITRNSKKSGK